MDAQHDDRYGQSTVRQLVSARLGAAAADRFLALIRPSLRFVADVGAEAGSFYGGTPQLPDGFDWPRYRGRPMLLLAQLDCARLSPLLGSDWTLPRDGHLLFFQDDDFVADFSFEHGDDGCQVVHVPATCLTAPPGDDAFTIPALPLIAHAVPSMPTVADPEADQAVGGDSLALLDLAETLSPFLPSVRHRLLGWCDSIDTRRPTGHRLLLQLEAEAGTRWGEIVSVSFWIRDEDLRGGRFGQVRRSYEVA
jgi:hypothetical protein